ncbi:MAG: hypothetical protein ABSC76_09915 [Terracidiphilus sp.]|jgi:hypothetical protein
MKKCKLQLVIASLIVFAQSSLGQNVKLANIALGMNETEVKTALVSNAPVYAGQASDYPGMHYLLAETEMESYAFTLIDGKVAAFSVVHLLPPGQLPFLPPGQQPTVSILRALITKQTWTPAKYAKGDTWWFSDLSGAPLSNPAQCRPESGEAWLPFGPAPSAKPDEQHTVKSTAGLMKPPYALYPSNCGVSIHLNLTPAESEDSVVTAVRYQVLDIKAMNAFLATHQ